MCTYKCMCIHTHTHTYVYVHLAPDPAEPRARECARWGFPKANSILHVRETVRLHESVWGVSATAMERRHVSVKARCPHWDIEDARAPLHALTVAMQAVAIRQEADTECKLYDVCIHTSIRVHMFICMSMCLYWYVCTGAPGQTASTAHDTNISAQVPCCADTCHLFPCMNSLKPSLGDTDAAAWLPKPGTRDRTPAPGLGLFATEHVPKHTWIASFGPMTWTSKKKEKDAKSPAANSNVARNGYSLPFNKPTALGHSSVWGTPQRGWQGRYHGPWINHTCCAWHCNTEFVPDEDAHTYNVVTTHVVAKRQEYLANYMAGYARPHNAAFERCFGDVCVCCACTHSTPHCHP
jgi:hypothetical protein